MMIQFRYFLLITLACFLLSACNSLWEKDNTPPPTPLVQFTPKIRPQPLWDARINFNLSQEDLKLSPAMTDTSVIIADQTGTITALSRSNGRIQWKTTVNSQISSGVAVNEQLIVVGTRNGDIIALSALDRRPLWRAQARSEILATPALGSNVVIVKSIDGKVSAFSSSDGHLIWRHQEVEPNLILKGASAPQLTPGAVILGYANGKIEKLALKDGHELWSQSVTYPNGAFAIQRMIDIDADPIIANNKVYAATYQGKVAGMNLGSGRVVWDHDISAYAGIAVDDAHVYVSDANSTVWAFDRENGRVVWKQNQLEARNITGPVLVGPYVVIGDAEGALHWLNRDDGNFAGRVQVSGKAILTKPITAGRTVYVITKDGYLTAYNS